MCPFRHADNERQALPHSRLSAPPKTYVSYLRAHDPSPRSRPSSALDSFCHGCRLTIKLDRPAGLTEVQKIVRFLDQQLTHSSAPSHSLPQANLPIACPSLAPRCWCRAIAGRSGRERSFETLVLSLPSIRPVSIRRPCFQGLQQARDQGAHVYRNCERQRNAVDRVVVVGVVASNAMLWV